MIFDAMMLGLLMMMRGAHALPRGLHLFRGSEPRGLCCGVWGTTSNTCPSGSSTIRTEAECKLASRCLGRSGNTVPYSWHDHPGGCFANDRGANGGDVHFNTNLVGGSTFPRHKICKKDAVTCVMEPERGYKYMDVAISTNFELQFTVTPHEYVAGWSNILHMTMNDSNDGWGGRIPAVWLRGSRGVIHLHVYVNCASNFNTCIVPANALTMNNPSVVVVRVLNGDIHVTVQGTKSFTWSSQSARSACEAPYRPAREAVASLYLSNPWSTPAVASVSAIYYNQLGGSWAEEDPLTWNAVSGSLSWEDSRSFCAARNQQLCSWAELCPGNRVQGGRHPTDKWVPVMDHANKWIQVGSGLWPECAAHDEIMGGYYGNPTWGTTRQNLHFRGVLACCPLGAPTVVQGYCTPNRPEDRIGGYTRYDGYGDLYSCYTARCQTDPSCVAVSQNAVVAGSGECIAYTRCDSINNAAGEAAARAKAAAAAKAYRGNVIHHYGWSQTHQNKNPHDIYYTMYKPAGKAWKRENRSQCYVNAKQFHGDRLDNPIWFIGSMSRTQCMEECRNRRDDRGRPCVAIEMSTHSTDPNTVARCELAWGCDYVRPWSGGVTFIMPQEEGPTPGRRLEASVSVDDVKFVEDIKLVEDLTPGNNLTVDEDAGGDDSGGSSVTPNTSIAPARALKLE